MKKKNLLIFSLLIVAASVRAFDLGGGHKGTLTQAGNNRLIWTQKSRNDVSVRGVFSGIFTDGKRDGIWGSFNYFLSANDGICFISDAMNVIHRDANRVSNGMYSYNAILREEMRAEPINSLILHV